MSSVQVAKTDWRAVQQAPPWAVDAWGLGCLMQEVYSGQFLTRTEELRNVIPIPKAVLPVISTAHQNLHFMTTKPCPVPVFPAACNGVSTLAGLSALAGFAANAQAQPCTTGRVCSTEDNAGGHHFLHGVACCQGFQ